jgi:hypothetical protein
MGMITVSHVTEEENALSFPWVVRCGRCGVEVARFSQEELTAMVTTEQVEPVECFACERDRMNTPRQNPRIPYPQDERAPYVAVRLTRRLLGLV